MMHKINSYHVTDINEKLIEARATILASWSYPIFHFQYPQILEELRIFYENILYSLNLVPYEAKQLTDNAFNRLFSFFNQIDPTTGLLNYFLKFEQNFQINTTLFSITPLLLSNPNLSPAETNSILYGLWKFGENWNAIIPYIYSNSSKYFKSIKHRIEEDLRYVNWYRPYRQYYMVQNSIDFTSHFCYKLLPKTITSDFPLAIHLIIEHVQINPLYAARFAMILKKYVDHFNLEIFLSIIDGIYSVNVDLFLQFCMMNDLFTYKPLDSRYHTYPYQITLPYKTPKCSATETSEESKVEENQPIQNESQHHPELAQHVLDDLKESNSILYHIIMREYVDINEEALHAFSENLYLLSQKTYFFVKKLVPQLIAKSTINEHLSPKIESYQDALLYKTLYSLPTHLKKIIDTFGADILSQNRIIYSTIGGDAASVIIRGNNGPEPKNLYCFMVLPLEYTLKPIPVQYQIIPPGSATNETMKIFETIITEIPKMSNIKFIFKTTDGDPRTGFWFNEPFDDGVLTDDNLSLPFIQLVEICKESAMDKPWPISDPIHLFKCGRAHAQGHLICLDPSRFICLNMQLFINATNLAKNLNDRSTHARMNDAYALEFFSFDTFVKLVANGRFDGAFYTMPFVFLNEAIRSSQLDKSERLELLSIALKVFLFHYNTIKSFGSSQMFPQRYSKGALGTLFGEMIYIKRLICTTIGIGIAIILDIPTVGLSRAGTHSIECHFGIMRMLQHENNTAKQGMRAAISAALVLENNKYLGLETKINTRENNGGVKIDNSQEKVYERLFFNANFIPSMIYNLMINGNVEIDSIDSLVQQINAYSEIYSKKPTTRSSKLVYPTAKPYARYLGVSNYKISTSPIPTGNINSPLSFYFQTDRAKSKGDAKYHAWFNTLVEFMKQMMTIQQTTPITEEEIQKQHAIGVKLSQLNHPVTLEPFLKPPQMNETNEPIYQPHYEATQFTPLQPQNEVTQLPPLQPQNEVTQLPPLQPQNEVTQQQPIEGFTSNENSSLEHSKEPKEVTEIDNLQEKQPKTKPKRPRTTKKQQQKASVKPSCECSPPRPSIPLLSSPMRFSCTLDPQLEAKKIQLLHSIQRNSRISIGQKNWMTASLSFKHSPLYQVDSFLSYIYKHNEKFFDNEYHKIDENTYFMEQMCMFNDNRLTAPDNIFTQKNPPPIMNDALLPFDLEEEFELPENVFDEGD